MESVTNAKVQINNKQNSKQNEVLKKMAKQKEEFTLAQTVAYYKARVNNMSLTAGQRNHAKKWLEKNGIVVDSAVATPKANDGKKSFMIVTTLGRTKNNAPFVRSVIDHGKRCVVCGKPCKVKHDLCKACHAGK